MGKHNRLFQEARRFVELAAENPGNTDARAKAKNALSSAYANSTIAEQEQLHQMQDRLKNLK